MTDNTAARSAYADCRCPARFKDHYEPHHNDCPARPKPLPTKCPEHSMPFLNHRKVEAFTLLLDWPGTSIVEHACEARLDIRKGYVDA